MRKLALILTSAALPVLASCGAVSNGPVASSSPAPQVSLDPDLVTCTANAASYRPGQVVAINCALGGTNRVPANVSLKLVRLGAGFSEGSATVATASWEAGQPSASLNWVANEAAAGSAFALVLDGSAVLGAPLADRVMTTARILRDGDLTRFAIDRHDANGMRVYDLAGGMSAEYALEKSLAGLAGGISHSWQVSRSGHGPKPVFATRDFLERSVQETVALYDRELGADRVFDTVILSTGYPTVPYLSQALEAPVLPLHFLASGDSVAEIRTTLDGANAAGYSAYATLGHDPSVDHSVAWIKLLDLPPEYRDFLIRHKVKRVIISGSTGTSGGETKARRVSGEATVTYDPGDIYLMYPGTSLNDEESLATHIHDLRQQTHLSDFVRVTDWESGVAPSQACRISKSIRVQTSGETEVFGLTPYSLGDLYDLSTTVTAALMYKNRGIFADASTPASGIVLNPYLMAYPAYEFRAGYLPIVYFQVVPAPSTLSKVESVVVPALERYFPERQVLQSEVWLNSSKNFGGRFFGEPYEAEIARLGFTNVRLNDYDTDEQWSANDGQVSILEQIVAAEASRPANERLSAFAQRREPLTIEEFRDALLLHPDLSLTGKLCNQ